MSNPESGAAGYRARACGLHLARAFVELLSPRQDANPARFGVFPHGQASGERLSENCDVGARRFHRHYVLFERARGWPGADLPEQAIDPAMRRSRAARLIRGMTRPTACAVERLFASGSVRSSCAGCPSISLSCSAHSSDWYADHSGIARELRAGQCDRRPASRRALRVPRDRSLLPIRGRRLPDRIWTRCFLGFRSDLASGCCCPRGKAGRPSMQPAYQAHAAESVDAQRRYEC